MRRRRRRRDDDDPVDWDRLESIPLVRREAPPESGEDYWMDATSAQSEATTDERRDASQIDQQLKDKLREEVVRPYAQNWILWISLGVMALVLAVWAVGGVDTLPIISVPDL
ncbi:unnamed protein product [Agarophyton chilense]